MVILGFLGIIGLIFSLAMKETHGKGMTDNVHNTEIEMQDFSIPRKSYM